LSCSNGCKEHAMKILRSAGAALVALALTGSPAAAAVIVYAGTITSGVDNAGIFGGVGDLANVAFTASFTYDPALGNHVTDATSERVTGGTDYGGASPITDASFTIGGVTLQFIPTLRGAAFTSATTGTFGHEAATPDTYLLLQVVQAGAPARLNDLVSGTPTACPSCQVYGLGSQGAINFSAFLDVDSVRVGSSDTGVVPEPATWALMILGFGGAGAMLRRRRMQTISL
jgi:hypothetical protein